jgi:N6-L-threonylcarbamoyladenine synthase
MRLLAIETSCDETAVAVVDAQGSAENLSYSVRGNALYSQAQKHAAYGGVYPNLAKREHAINLVPLLDAALSEARLSTLADQTISKEQMHFLQTLLQREEGLCIALIRYAKEHSAPAVDAIAVTQGPGLEPALWVGINFARALSYLWNVPILPVNHLEGHIIASAVSLREGSTNEYVAGTLDFPVLGLILSGGHTEFVHATTWGDYAVVGSTRDDSIGEAFDKVARLVGVPYPGGPALSALAKKGRSNPALRTMSAPAYAKLLPRPMMQSGDLDFSFSGLKTAALYYVRDKGEMTESDQHMLAAAFEESVKDVLIAKTKLALTLYPSKTFLIGGGVSANTYIREHMQQLFEKETGVQLRLPALGLSTDNAVMIGMAGYLMHLRNAPTLTGTDMLTADGTLKMGHRTA